MAGPVVVPVVDRGYAWKLCDAPGIGPVVRRAGVSIRGSELDRGRRRRPAAAASSGGTMCKCSRYGRWRGEGLGRGGAEAEAAADDEAIVPPCVRSRRRPRAPARLPMRKPYGVPGWPPSTLASAARWKGVDIVHKTKPLQFKFKEFYNL